MLKLLRIAFLLFCLVCLGCMGYAGWVWHYLHTPVSHGNPDEPFEVARGESLDQIMQGLQQRGILEQTLPLRVYLKLRKETPVIRSGSYTFPSPIAPMEVLDRLKHGGDFSRVTVIEGWTRFEIADAMVKVPTFHLSNRDQAMKLLNNPKLISDIDPGAKNLEGYLFPDTYFIDSKTSAQDFVSETINRFRQVWNERLQQPASRAGKTAREIVTEASLIETEAKLKTERPVVASVIENRLARKMSLSLDSTLIYAAKLAGTWKNDGKVYQSDINRVSPYNTRRNKGLPPGPIASPGLSSLESAVYPAHTAFLYYVRNPDRNDGAHNFYADSRSFDRGVDALRAWELKHPAKTR